MALEDLLCMLRPAQAGNSFNYPFLAASEALLRKDCLNFLVDNTEQVQKTQSEGDGRRECEGAA